MEKALLFDGLEYLMIILIYFINHYKRDIFYIKNYLLSYKNMSHYLKILR